MSGATPSVAQSPTAGVIGPLVAHILSTPAGRAGAAAAWAGPRPPAGGAAAAAGGGGAGGASGDWGREVAIAVLSRPERPQGIGCMTPMVTMSAMFGRRLGAQAGGVGARAGARAWAIFH